jgi:hypothetical protein
MALVAIVSFGMPVQAQPLPVVDVVQVPVQKLNLVQSIVSAVNSAADNTLEYVLNGLAWDVANLAIESMTKSLVNWINSGFQGSPAFVTDLKQNLRGLEDAVAGRFFAELSTQAIVTTHFQDRVLDAARLAYYLHTSPESFYERYPSTLNQVSPDSRAFLDGDFSKGGFNAWFVTTMNLQDNPAGQQLLLQNELSGLLSSATNGRLQELSWGDGFRSLRACDAQATTPAAGVDLSGVEPCAFGEMRTPGSVIQRRLNDVLGSGRDRLIVADDFNEIVSALLNQLVGQVLGANGGGGLSGVSRPSAGGGASYIDTATDPSQSTGSGVLTAEMFTTTVTDQRSSVQTYQASWQKIADAADAAIARCSASDVSAAEAVRMRAQAALLKAADALSSFDAILVRIEAANDAGGNQSLAIAEIGRDFTTLSRSLTIPRGEELAEAQIESQDTGEESEPGSLYVQMIRLANAPSCRSSAE